MRWSWIFDHGSLFRHLLGQHIYLAVMPVLWGLLISLPLGILCVRWPRIYPPILALTSILYALPSIALFIFLLNYTGLNPSTAIIPLTVYTLSVLVRNVVDGLRSVDEPIRQAATAMGFSGTRRLLQVELPIAVPVVMAGLRVATVSNISLVSIASLIGLGGLGQLFTDGFQRNFPTEIWAGVALTVLLAFVADTLLVLAQRLLTPWTRGRRRSTPWARNRQAVGITVSS
jgi:osmoprotectant transport system permease protein